MENETKEEPLTGTNPHMEQYELAERAFDCIHRTADSYLLGMHHGKQWNDIALNFMGVRTTYLQLEEEIEMAARSLFAYGIRQGDYVTFVMPNLRETVVYIYACWRIGAVANMVDPRTNPEGILERANRTGSKLFITVFNICEESIDGILDRLAAKHVVLVSPSDSLKGSLKPVPLLGGIVYGAKLKKFLESHAGGKYIWHRDFLRDYTYHEDVRADFVPRMLAAVVYTSGTASDGVIKGAAMSHEAINAVAAATYYAARPEDRVRQDTFGGFIPFFAAYGIMNGMHTCLCGGLEILLVPIFDHNKAADMILKLKPNSFLGVPRFHEQLADHPKLRRKNNRLAFIKNPVAGGDRISPASIERVNAAYARSGSKTGLRVGYGSTEMGGSIAVMPSYDPTTPACGHPSKEGNYGEFPAWREEGCVGYLLPVCKAVVIDPDTGEILPFGVDGELCVSSLSQMECYWGNPAATEEITYTGPDGTKYYRMGDKGHLDERGCFYFLDRYKRSLMRPDGFTVHPAPMENTISGHGAVEQCAVAGLARKENTAGTIPTAFVVLREGYDAPEKQREALLDIDKLCLQKLPTYYRPLAYRAVKELPYTPMGKIDFRQLEQEAFDPANFLLADFEFFPEWKPD